jgi:hypothetical protein
MSIPRISFSLLLPIVELALWAVLVPTGAGLTYYRLYRAARGSQGVRIHSGQFELTVPRGGWVGFALASVPACRSRATGISSSSQIELQLQLPRPMVCPCGSESPRPGVSRPTGAPRACRRWRHGHHAVCPRRLHQPLLRRAESLAPDLVRGIHQDYVKAGSEILETNTFGANRVRLAAFGIAEKLKDINRAGVRLAREAARGRPSWPAPWDRWECASNRSAPLRSPKRAPFPRADRRAGRSRRGPADLRDLRQPGRTARSRHGRPRGSVGDSPIVAQVTIDDFGHLPGGTDTEPSPARWIPGRWT